MEKRNVAAAVAAMIDINDRMKFLRCSGLGKLQLKRVS